MTFQQRIAAFVQLGRTFREWANEGHTAFRQAYFQNPWFTEHNLHQAFSAWADQLSTDHLEKWTTGYSFDQVKPANIAIIMAGNIPLVGLHDLLSVLVCGHRAIVKPSSDDTVLMKLVIDTLNTIDPEFGNLIHISEERLPKDFDAVIATGSNNTNRYFEYYFRSKPRLLRRNRSSAAILTGNETPDDLQRLGSDIFTYFGLGCRNVSKLYVPESYDFTLFFESLEAYRPVIDHNKYANNYTYHKAIFLMNMTPHLDNGFLLLKEDSAIASPLSAVFYETYGDISGLDSVLQEKRDEIQCIVAKTGGYIAFGKAQAPDLWDYADDVDTLKFCLTGISPGGPAA